MAALLRIFKKPNKWPSGDQLSWLDQGDVSADPLENFATANCKLSVYLVGDDQDKVDRVMAGFVAARTSSDKAQPAEYILFDESLVSAVGIKVEEVSGDTADMDVNSWHRDLTEVSAKKLTALLISMVPTLDPMPMLAKEVTQKLARSIVDHRISLADIKWSGNARAQLVAEIAQMSKTERDT